MKNKIAAKKKLIAIIVVMFIVIVPGVLRLISNDAFINVRAVDTLMLFASGMVTGALIVIAKNYYSLKKL